LRNNSIGGATNLVLVMTNLNLTNAGSYSLVASNSSGTKRCYAGPVNDSLPSGRGKSDRRKSVVRVQQMDADLVGSACHL
jgi:hypothetical protein